MDELCFKLNFLKVGLKAHIDWHYCQTIVKTFIRSVSANTLLKAFPTARTTISRTRSTELKLAARALFRKFYKLLASARAENRSDRHELAYVYLHGWYFKIH